MTTGHIVFITIHDGRYPATVDDTGVVKLFATRAEAETEKGALGAVAAVEADNLWRACETYGVGLPVGFKTREEAGKDPRPGEK